MEICNQVSNQPEIIISVWIFFGKNIFCFAFDYIGTPTLLYTHGRKDINIRFIVKINIQIWVVRSRSPILDVVL